MSQQRRHDWSYLPMGKVCDFVGGSQPPKETFVYEPQPGYIRLIQIQDYKSDKRKTYIPELKARRFCSQEDVMIGRYGPPIFQILRGLEGAYNVALMKASPKNDDVLDKEYLYYFLRNKTLFNFVVANSERTAGQDGIRKELLEEYIIPLPPIAEQHRIVAILDRADAVRRKRQEAIALTEELLRSTFLEMFGDLEQHEWEMSSVESIANSDTGFIRTGPFGSQLLHSEFVDEGIAVLGIDNAVQNEFRWAKPRFITLEKYKQLQRYTVRPRDVLITIMGTCGRCAIVPNDCPTAINTKHLCCITLNHEKCLPEFLHSYFLIHPYARRYLEKTVKGAIMDGLNMGIIKQLPVPLVPIELQKNYSRLWHQLIHTKQRIIDAQEEDENLFSSLLEGAFRGEL